MGMVLVLDLGKMPKCMDFMGKPWKTKWMDYNSMGAGGGG